MYYPFSENKGADQLRGHREADLRLCFRIMQIVGFPMGRLISKVSPYIPVILTVEKHAISFNM